MEDDSDENSDDEDEQENEDEDDSDDDESASPAQVRAAASLLATMKQSRDDNADGALLTDDDGKRYLPGKPIMMHHLNFITCPP